MAVSSDDSLSADDVARVREKEDDDDVMLATESDHRARC